MPTFKTWPEDDPPSDNGLVVVVLHRRNRATVMVIPPSMSRVAAPDDVELDTPAALESAKMHADLFGLETVYVSVNAAAPWNPKWGVLTE